MKVFAVTAVTFSCISLAVGWQVGQEVNTTSGIVIGHASARHKEVSEYLGTCSSSSPNTFAYGAIGIPYAAAPIGKLRFMPPEKYIARVAIKAHKFVSVHDSLHTNNHG